MKTVSFAITSPLNTEGAVPEDMQAEIRNAIRYHLRPETTGTVRDVEVKFNDHICTTEVSDWSGFSAIQWYIGNALYCLNVVHKYIQAA